MMLFRKKTKNSNPDSFESAWGYALFLLGFRTHSSGEIKEKLQGRGYTPLVRQSTLERLQKERLLDDHFAAQMWVENFMRFKLYGYYYIKQKLLSKHIPREICDSVLSTLFDEKEEYKIAQKFVKRISTTQKELSRLKLAAQLQRRGFRSSVIQKILPVQ